MNYPFRSPNGYEERLNRQFAAFLYYSLQTDASLLNPIHRDHPFGFSSKAALVAHQDAPLPHYRPEEVDRKIDWVVEDEHLLVGYESKYGDHLGSKQLRGELAKLRLNASDNQEVKLVAVTPHTTPPRVLKQFADEPVYWVSWTTVSRRLHQISGNDVAPEQRPILRMLKDLFEAEDMLPYTGFDHHDKQQYRLFIRDLRQELVDTELENRGKVHAYTTYDSSPVGYKRLVPKYLDIPFVRESRGEGKTRSASYLTAIVDTETHEVHSGVVFNVRTVERHRTFVAEHVDELVEYATESGLSLWASMNSLNQWKTPPQSTDDSAEMREWLSTADKEAITVDGTRFKKAFFVRQCTGDTPEALVQDAKSALLEQFKCILEGDSLYRPQTLADR